MSLAGQVSALASRIATEFNTIRGLIAAKEPTLPTLGGATTFLRGDRSWATLFSATAPAVVTQTGAAGAAATMARSDHSHGIGFVLSATGSTDLPSAFPNGVSNASASSSNSVAGSPWPGSGLGNVITFRVGATNQRTVQWFVDKNGGMYWRVEPSTDVWSAWQSAEPAIANGTTQQFYRGDQSWVTLPNDFAKAACRVTTRNIGNITLSGLQTIDGVTLVAGDRVLVAAQSAASANGIYVAASGTWARAADAATIAQLVNAVVPITSGTINAGSMWSCMVLPTATLGSSTIGWTPLVRGLDVDYGAAKAISNGTDQTHATSATWQQVTFDQLAYQGSSGVSYASSQFTIQRAGAYVVSAIGCFANVAGTNPRRVFQIESFTTEAVGSGNQIARMEVPMVAGIFPTFSISGEDFLTAGDKVRLVCYQNSGAALIIKNSTAPAYLSIRRSATQ